MSESDRGLRRLFEAAREGDRAGAPSFARTWEAARRRAGQRSPATRRPAPLWGWATLAAAALVAVVVVTTRPSRPTLPAGLDAEIALACEISEWTGPTSGLAALAALPLLDDVSSLSLTSLALPGDEDFSTAEDSEGESSGNSQSIPGERGWR
jgi:hypothetical protein